MYTKEDAINRKMGFDIDDKEYFWPYSIRLLEEGPSMLCLMYEHEVFLDESSIDEYGWDRVNTIDAKDITSKIKQDFIDIIFTNSLRCE